MKRHWNPKWNRPALVLGLFVLGLIFWEVLLAYAYFALPCWGADCLLLLHWWLQKLKIKQPKASARITAVVATVLTICFIFFCVVEGFILSGSRGADDPDCDYILVLGAAVRGETPSRSLRERLDAAKDYLEAHPDAGCVVSGGMGWGESISEAECMARWLTDQGIDPARILQEDQATSTWENLTFTLKLIEEETGTRPQTLAVVSSEYHLYRASLMAADLEIDFLGVPAKTHPWPNRIHYYFREFFGVCHYWALGN